jgi:hypothetical protein
MAKDKDLSNLDTSQVYNLNEIAPFDYDIDVIDNDLIVSISDGSTRNEGTFKGLTGIQAEDVVYDEDGNLIQELNNSVDQNLGKLRLDKNVQLSYYKDSNYGIYTGTNGVTLENWFNLKYNDAARYTINLTEYRYIIPLVTWQGTTLSQTTVLTTDGLIITSNSITTGYNLTSLVDRNATNNGFIWNTEIFDEKYVIIEFPEIQYLNGYSFQNESLSHAVYNLEIYASLNGIDYIKIDEILDIDVSGVTETYERELAQQESCKFIKLVPLSGIGNGGIKFFNALALSEPAVNYQLSFNPFIFDDTYFNVTETPTEIQISTKELTQIDTKLLKWENYVRLEQRRVLESIVTAAGTNIRNLNAVVVNNLNIITSLPNFILPAGLYYIKGQAQTYLTNYFSISLRDISNNIYLMGTNAYNSSAQTNGSTSVSVISGIVYIPSNTTMRMMQYAQTASSTGASQGGGVIDTSNPDFNYATISELEIWKIAELEDLEETALDTHWNNVVLLMNGDQIEDNSKYKYPLTRISGTVVDNTTIGNGGFGSGYQTPRIKSYPTINHNLGNGDFTIELNYYASSIPANSILLSDDFYAAGGLASGAFMLYFSNSTTLRFIISTNPVVFEIVSYTSSLYVNQWNSIALTRSGSTFNLFFNGILVSTGTSTLSLNNNRLFIGDSISINTAFPGTISNVRVTKGVARYTERYFPLSVPFAEDTVDIQTTTETALDPYWNNVVLLMNGTSLGDSSKFAYPMTQINGTAALVDNTTIGTGGFGNGYQSAVWLSQYGHLNHLLSNNNFTFEISFYTSDISNTNNTGLWSDGIFLSNNGYNLYVLNSTTVRHNIGAVVGATIIRDTVIPGGTVNNWVHFCIVREGNVFRYFVNGILSGSVTTALTFISNQIKIGSTTYFSNSPFSGTLANIRLTKGVARYSANYTPPSSIFTKDTP